MTKTYCKPFKRGESWRSQEFGANPNNGTNGAGGHSGNDDAAPEGTPIHAAGDGVIEYAGTFDDTYADNLLWLINYGGNITVLNCGDTEPTFVYAHQSRFAVKTGDRVRKGQVIGYCGSTGTRSTGSHCHNECIPPGYVLNSPTLGRVDPDRYMTEWPEDVPTITTQGATKMATPTDAPLISSVQAEAIAQRSAALTIEGVRGLIQGAVMVNRNQAEDIAQRAAALVTGKK